MVAKKQKIRDDKQCTSGKNRKAFLVKPNTHFRGVVIVFVSAQWFIACGSESPFLESTDAGEKRTGTDSNESDDSEIPAVDADTDTDTHIDTDTDTDVDAGPGTNSATDGGTDTESGVACFVTPSSELFAGYTDIYEVHGYSITEITIDKTANDADYTLKVESETPNLIYLLENEIPVSETIYNWRDTVTDSSPITFVFPGYLRISVGRIRGSSNLAGLDELFDGTKILRVSCYCGNGSLDSDELCDDGNMYDGDGCDSNCTLTGCGNRIPTSGEACDDGNLEDGDGCSGTCESEVCDIAGASDIYPGYEDEATRYRIVDVVLSPTAPAGVYTMTTDGWMGNTIFLHRDGVEVATASYNWQAGVSETISSIHYFKGYLYVRVGLQFGSASLYDLPVLFDGTLSIIVEC